MSRPVRERTMGELLIVVQVALALVLLAGAGALTRQSMEISRVDWGFRANNVGIIGIDEPSSVRSEAYSAKLERLSRRLDAIEGLSGVEGAAAGNIAPLAGHSGYGSVSLATSDRAPGLDEDVQRFEVSPGFLDILEARFVEGADFSETLTGPPPGVIVTSDVARRLFGEEALGRHLYFARRALQRDDVEGKSRDDVAGMMMDLESWDLGEPYVIQGVIQPMRLWGITSAEATVFTDVRRPSIAEVPPERRNSGKYVIALRPGVDREAVMRAAANQVAGTGEEASISDLALLDDLLAQALGGRGASRLGLLLFGAFGGLSLVLAAGGISGIVLESVGQRELELGIRSALGARSAQLVWLVGSKVMRLIVWGLGLGYALVWAISRSIEATGAPGDGSTVVPVDMLSLGAVSALLLFVAFSSALAASLRAGRLDRGRILR